MALTVRSLWFLKPGALAHTSPAPISSYQPWTLARDGTQGLEKRLLTARMPRKEVPQRRGKVAPQGTVPRLRNPCLLLPKISAEPWIGLGPHKRAQHSSFGSGVWWRGGLEEECASFLLSSLQFPLEVHAHTYTPRSSFFW